jgi:hypothetical protein
MCDSTGEDSGFARTGASHNQKWAAPMFNRTSLSWVEIFQ